MKTGICSGGGLIELRVNNRIYNYIKPFTIFQACLDKKIYVPRFCYHVALKIAGNCRMCLVEEKSSIKPVVACAITIMNGMSIYTNTELVKKAREGVIEYLLINHPLDCPICDQGGECDLQDQTIVFGADRGRFYENKRAVINKNLGFLIKTFLNRCIHCARCTRFMNDLGGTEFSLLGRGLHTEISLYTKEFITSELSGNIIDLCPVGALTSKPYAFRARPWELISVYTFDIVEPFGSNIDVNYRSLEVMRILPRLNNEINDEWISDKTRFYYDSFKIQRLVNIFFRNKDSVFNISWYGAFSLLKNIYFKSKLLLNLSKFYMIGFLDFTYGEYTDLETAVSLKKFYTNLSVLSFGNNFYDFRENFFGNEFFIEGEKPINISNKKTLILDNVNPRLESPVLNLKLKKLLNENQSYVVFVVGFLSNLNYEFVHLGNLFQKKQFLLENSLNYKNSETVYITKNIAIKGANSFMKSFYRVSESIATLSMEENSFVCGDKFFTTYQHITFNLGYPTKGISTTSKNSFSIRLLHHIADDLEDFPFLINCIMLPMKFYLEKVGSYYSESGYFFSTLTNIYGYYIKGTAEEWKIFVALSELLHIRFNKKDLTKTNQGFGRPNFFEYKTEIFKKGIQYLEEMFAVNKNSTVNNYYQKGLLSRLSPVLNLCAKSYVVHNDYKINLNI